MPRNGTGTYVPPASTWNPGVNGVLATTADFNGLLADLSAAMSQSVSADGQTPMTGNLPMGNNKITGLANGSANTDAAAFGQIGRYAGNCRLTKSGANLLLSPFNGNQLTINGSFQTVPSGGVTLAPTGIAGTLYYIYAFMVGTTMTLESSTTSYAIDVTTGMPIKSGDSTRTLVGMARPIAGPAWQDSSNQRFVVSWFNPKPIDCLSVLASSTGNVGTSYSEVATALRCEFLLFAGNAASFNFTGSLTNNVTTGPNQAFTTYALDGVVVDGYSGTVVSTAGVQLPIACAYVVPKTVSEGYHYITLFALQTQTSTSTYTGGGSIGSRCANSGVIQG